MIYFSRVYAPTTARRMLVNANKVPGKPYEISFLIDGNINIEELISTQEEKEADRQIKEEGNKLKEQGDDVGKAIDKGEISLGADI